MKTSYKKLIEFSRAADVYFDKFPKETKLRIALEKVKERCNPLFEQYNKSISDLSLKHAKEDSDGCVLYTEDVNGRRTYKFSKDGLKAKDEEVNLLFTKEDSVEIEPFFAASLPKDLGEDWIEVFKGFVIEFPKIKINTDGDSN